MVPVRRSPFFNQTVSAKAAKLHRAMHRPNRDSGMERDISWATALVGESRALSATPAPQQQLTGPDTQRSALPAGRQAAGDRPCCNARNHPLAAFVVETATLHRQGLVRIEGIDILAAIST